MPPQLALLVSSVFVAWVFWHERRRWSSVSNALLWPALWYLVASSRPVGIWLTIWGVKVPGGTAEDGSVVDRNFYLILMGVGIWILSRRRIPWGALWRRNRWLIALIGFMALSIIWSAYPFVSFKRFIKVSASIVMALVVLTDRNILENIQAIIRSVAYVHFPMSILFIRYFRHLGLSFDWSGAAESWQGIASSKNVLGQVTAIALLYFLWDVYSRWRRLKWKNVSILYVFMGLYLIKGSDDAFSLTSVAVLALGLFVFFRLGMIEHKPQKAREFATWAICGTVALILLVAVHSVVMFSEQSIFGWLITKLGRNITLTDRTIIWSELYQVVAANPLFGVGYGGFWIGEQANIPFSRRMTWVLGQAHSGYVDTYLQIGWIGILLLAGTFLATAKRLLQTLRTDFELGRFALTLFIVITFVNMTETSHLRGDHHLWLLFLLVVIAVPLPKKLPSSSYEGSEAPQKKAFA